VHEHSDVVLAISLAVGLAFVVYMLRKLFDRRRGTRFPIEEIVETDEAASEDDSTLIT
jgi:hypothetical protein